MSNLDITPSISQAIDNYPDCVYVIRVWKESKGYSVKVKSNRPNILPFRLDYDGLINDIDERGILFDPLSYIVLNLDKSWVGVLKQKEGIIPALGSNHEPGTIFQYVREDT